MRPDSRLVWPKSWFTIEPVFMSTFASILLASLLGLAQSELPPAPDGFVVEELIGGWKQPVGSVAVLDDTTLVWEKGGTVWAVDGNGSATSEPLIDLGGEVGNWRDHGLLGFVVHPNFKVNGWIYLYYVVDRHHLLEHGGPAYSEYSNMYFRATIARLTRYTIDIEDGELGELVPDSRKVLIGESITTGVPILMESHAGGGMAFGQDGTLLLAVGDCANLSQVDTGGPFPSGFVTEALADGILKPHEDVGALRCQLVDSLSGKLLRIDATTGDGLSSNPFFDPDHPRAARSRVWALGLRNPFRLIRIPGTGGHDPDLPDPGTVVIGDVGWDRVEEITYVTGPGQNLGWPFYEGMTCQPGYSQVDLVNPMTVNPLEDGELCSSGFPFRDLIQQDSLQTARTYLNHCGVLQAEDRHHSGWTYSTAHFGFLGGGALVSTQADLSSVEFMVKAGEAGSRFHLRYALDHSQSVSLQLEIDGQLGQQVLKLPPTGSLTEWRMVSVSVAMDSGPHLIRLLGKGLPGQLALDCAALTDPDSSSLPVIPESVPTFTHLRPRLDWFHVPQDDPRVATYDAFGAAATPVLGTPESEVEGPDYAGKCVIAGPMMGFSEPGAGDETVPGREPWPESWRGLFFGEYTQGWVMWAGLNEDGSFRALQKFIPNPGLKYLVSLSTNASASQLDAVTGDGHVYRYTWSPEFNRPPRISVTSTEAYGAAPHSVSFDAASSEDPEGSELTFTWDFGDGSPPSSGALVDHVFEGEGGGPVSYEVTLVVSDSEGESATQELLVSVDNSPPVVGIIYPVPNTYYSITQPTFLPLQSFIHDEEHGADELTCAWRVRLHHNEHFHNEPLVHECQSEALVTPMGCGDEIYWYEFELTVTDLHGLTSTRTVAVYPDCPAQGVCIADLNDDLLVDALDLGMLLGSWGTSDNDLDGDKVVTATDLSRLLSEWGTICQ